MTALVVCADDLGLTPGINAGVHRAHVQGVVTSTSLLAVGRAFDDAVAMLRATPSLDVGVHLALVGEDPPLLGPHEVPTLVDEDGQFAADYRTLVVRAAARRIDPGDVYRELRAQIERVRGAGLSISHLNTHQHVHLWPLIGEQVRRLAVEYRIGIVRLPRAHASGPLARGVNLLAGTLSAGLRRDRLGTCDYAGLDEAGAMDAAAIRRAVRVLAGRRGTTTRPAEINLHPGLPDAAAARFGWDYRWADEVAAACDTETARMITDHGYRLVSFADLRPPS